MTFGPTENSPCSDLPTKLTSKSIRLALVNKHDWLCLVITQLLHIQQLKVGANLRCGNLVRCGVEETTATPYQTMGGMQFVIVVKYREVHMTS
jgi:hypothetical protein